MMTKPAGLAVVGLCLSVVLGVGVAWALNDSVATIEGSSQGVIEGDSTLKEAPKAILVAAVGFGINVPPALLGGGTGKPIVKPLTMVKMPDKASPKLLRAAFTGESLKVNILWFMVDQLTNTKRKSFTVTLDGAFIQDIDVSGTVLQEGGVNEQITFSYSKVTFRDERSLPAVQVCIDVVLNKLC